MTASERAELRARDSGDRSDPVWLVGGASRRYHDDRECYQLSLSDADEPLEMARAEAWRRDRAPCKHCVLNRDGGPADP